LLLISPELLAEKPFERLLLKETFRRRLCLLSIDEMHLILDWGNGFRVAYKQIGVLLARMPITTALIAVTATLPAMDVSKLAETLGLTPGSFHFSRRSNRRTDLRMEFRELVHGLSGWDFPDLRWIIEGTRKTIVYCDTISLAFRLFVYFWNCVGSDRAPHHMRLYTAIFTSDYNAETRTKFVHDNAQQIIISTDALKVGNDFPNVADVVVLNSRDPNDIVQKTGRAGRDPGIVKDPRGIVYFPKSLQQRAQKLVDEGAQNSTASKGGSASRRKKDNGEKKNSSRTETLPLDMARWLLASCIDDGQDKIYENPASDPPCHCETCPMSSEPRLAACSKCEPDPIAIADPVAEKTSTQPAHTSQVPYVPRTQTITEPMQQHGTKVLDNFRFKVWNRRRSLNDRHLPPAAMLPDSVIKNILNTRIFPFLHTVQDLQGPLGKSRLTDSEKEELLEVLAELDAEFESMREKTKKNVPTK
jgi:hypothetical protein